MITAGASSQEGVAGRHFPAGLEGKPRLPRRGSRSPVDRFDGSFFEQSDPRPLTGSSVKLDLEFSPTGASI
jgi:hypothetical protein